jgi:hypothetical protein
MNELAQVCAELVALANAAPPGAVRDRMQADLANLRQRLEALPGRVARDSAMQPREVVQRVLHREIRFAFADVLRWSN